MPAGFSRCLLKMSKTYYKDANAKKNYKFDFAALTNGVDGANSDWLASGESIQSYSLAVDTGITLESDSLTDSNTSVTIVVSGGTPGQSYKIVCRPVTTPNGLIDDFTMIFKINQQ